MHHTSTFRLHAAGENFLPARTGPSCKTTSNRDASKFIDDITRVCIVSKQLYHWENITEKAKPFKRREASSSNENLSLPLEPKHLSLTTETRWLSSSKSTNWRSKSLVPTMIVLSWSRVFLIFLANIQKPQLLSNEVMHCLTLFFNNSFNAKHSCPSSQSSKRKREHLAAIWS